MKAVVAALLTGATVLLTNGMGCSLSGDSSMNLIGEVPEPDTVDFSALPPNSDRVYYFLITVNNAEKGRKGPEWLLKELLENRFEVEKAWFPVHSTFCMNAVGVDALLVQLIRPDERIFDLGYASDPGQNIPNCGIRSFKQYTFER